MILSLPAIVESRCAMAKEVRPFMAFCRAFCTMRSLCVSSALVASSSSITLGSRIRARQMATRCFWPPESRLPRGPTSVSRPELPFLKRNARFAICWHLVRNSSETVSPSSKPYKMLLRTVVLKRIGS
mmetsp:Transcript_77003/g.135774  ORF Transcript_77003/g.135774 Transcript_77003/m.135774 type:complete len:128 (-) Transcript_77003:3564-3947(-)